VNNVVKCIRIACVFAAVVAVPVHADFIGTPPLDASGDSSVVNAGGQSGTEVDPISGIRGGDAGFGDAANPDTNWGTTATGYNPAGLPWRASRVPAGQSLGRLGRPTDDIYVERLGEVGSIDRLIKIYPQGSVDGKGDGTGTIPVPAPGAVALAALGLGLVAVVRRLR
jgi:hypothetical protein